MNPTNTVLRSGCHPVWVFFSITTGIRKMVAETEELHSTVMHLTSYFAKVLSMQDIILHPFALLKDREACTFSYVMQTW